MLLHCSWENQAHLSAILDCWDCVFVEEKVSAILSFATVLSQIPLSSCFLIDWRWMKLLILIIVLYIYNNFRLYWYWNLILAWKQKHLLSSTSQLRCRNPPVWFSMQNRNTSDCCILRETLTLKSVSNDRNLPFMQSDDAKELTSGLRYPCRYYSALFYSYHRKWTQRSAWFRRTSHASRLCKYIPVSLWETHFLL